MLSSFLEATLVISLAGIVALGGRFLDGKGVAAAVAVGYCVYVMGGRSYFLALLVFFVVAGFTTRYRYREKYGEAGRGIRTWSNVLANGLAAAIIPLLGYLSFTNSSATLAMYLGAVSSVFSDTMSTEVGLLSKSQPRMITTLKPASPGTPGAVSLLGLAAGFFTGFILAAAVLLYGVFFELSLPTHVILVVSVLAGFSGSLFDSVFGGLFQSRYRCEVCGRAVEVKKHCGGQTVYVSGSRLVNNEVVNLLTSIYGAFVAFVVWVYMG
ncbi:MAG: DUF92 domain-containing protein [Candidatus Caldarchaeum sp.]|nr:DUF92 domain-containing protein [Candidatus Caldarchaeum sp.]